MRFLHVFIYFVLSISVIKATIISEMDAAYGPPASAAEQSKFATAMATAIYTVLTVQATVSVTGATTAGTPGGPLPIVAQPGVIQ